MPPRAGRDVRRRHRGDLVSDHAVVQAGRNADRLHEALPHRPRDGKATFAVVQAEDELAAIGMAIGAGWAGARSMTATAGPGISLMTEFIGLGYFAEIPAVIFDVQRVGPTTGLPTRTQQGDLLTTALLSHGDTKHPMLFPCSPGECFSMAVEAFDFAEQFQTPVFVMTDLDLGMNNWMTDPFEYPDEAHRSRQGAQRRGPGAARRLRPLQGRGRRRRRLPHPARHQPPRGGLLHPRQRPQREGAVHRARRRLHQQHGPSGPQVRDDAQARSRAASSIAPRAPRSASSPSAPRDYAVRESCDQLQSEYDIAGQLPAAAGRTRSRRT